MYTETWYLVWYEIQIDYNVRYDIFLCYSFCHHIKKTQTFSVMPGSLKTQTFSAMPGSLKTQIKSSQPMTLLDLWVQNNIAMKENEMVLYAFE